MPTTAPGYVGPKVGSSLTQLYQSMARFFEAQSIGAKVYLGLKYRDLWDTSRVVIIDGEFDGDNAPKVRNAGAFAPVGMKKSYNPRELALWERPITLSIRAVDPTNPDSEQAQIEATETLIEQTIQALWGAMALPGPTTGIAQGLGQANIDFAGSKAVWCDPGSATQQTWGKEFLITFTYKCVLFDTPDFVQTGTPNLEKGPLLSTMQSGANASVASKAGTTAIIANLGFCRPDQVGMTLTLSGAASPGNNGSFPIAYFLSPSRLVISNADAVAPDANDGAIAWSIGPAQ